MTAAMSDWAQAMFAVPFGLEQAGIESIQKRLCAGVMILTTTRNHRVAVVSNAAPKACEVPAGKHPRKLVNVRLRVSRDRVALRIELRCTVGVEQSVPIEKSCNTSRAKFSLGLFACSDAYRDTHPSPE